MWLLSKLGSFEHIVFVCFYSQMVMQAWLMSIITGANYIFIKKIYEIWNISLLEFCKYIIAKNVVQILVQTNMISINHDKCQSYVMIFLTQM